MVGQHHAARANANLTGATGHVTDQHRRCRTGNARHVVVLRQPEAPVTQALGLLREVKRVGKGLRRRTANGHGCEVENGKWEHGGIPKGATI